MAGRSTGEPLTAAGGAPPHRLARNAAAGAGRHAVGALLGLAVMPYALDALGAERYGLWAVGGAVLTAVRLFDLGLERAVARDVAVAGARGAADELADVVAAALPLAAGLGGLAALGVWAGRAWLVEHAFSVATGLRAEASLVVVGCAIVAWVEGAFAPYRATLVGLGRMDVASGIDALQRVASALGTVLALALGYGLAGLVAKNLATAAGAGLVYRARAGRLAPPRSAAERRPRWTRRTAARRLLVLGSHVQVVNVGAVALEVGSKAILARVVGLGAVASWEIALRLTQQLGAALLAAVVAVFPAAAELGARSSDDRRPAERLRDLYRTATRAMAVAVVAGFGLLAALSGPFVAAWLGAGSGAGHEAVARTVVVLCAGWAVAILSTPAAMVAQAAGAERDVTAAGLVTPLVGIGGAALLAPSLGLDGVAAGVAAGLVAGGLAMAWRFRRAFGLRWRDVVPLEPGALAALALGLAVAAALGRALPAGLGWVVAAGALGAGAALAAGRVLDVAWPRPAGGGRP